MVSFFAIWTVFVSFPLRSAGPSHRGQYSTSLMPLWLTAKLTAELFGHCGWKPFFPHFPKEDWQARKRDRKENDMFGSVCVLSTSTTCAEILFFFISHVYQMNICSPSYGLVFLNDEYWLLQPANMIFILFFPLRQVHRGSASKSCAGAPNSPNLKHTSDWVTQAQSVHASCLLSVVCLAQTQGMQWDRVGFHQHKFFGLLLACCVTASSIIKI